MWSRDSDYRVLYPSVSDKDGGAIIAALQQMNVPYKFEGGGAISVPAANVHEVRLRLASQGLPKGTVTGFELMETQKLGASQFQEQVNYQRGLEGELVRSIQSIAAVQTARVHLALTKPSPFIREQKKPSASVLLNLYPGRTVDAAQVNAIVHLVSSSVPDLPVKNVTVVDQSGNLLSSNGNGEAVGELDANQLKYLRNLEQSYVQRIEAILAPITGPGDVRAQVTAEVDFSATERAEESYKPNQNPSDASIRSQQTSESSNTGGALGMGVPGAASNQPGAPGTLTNQPPAPGVAQTGSSTPGASAPNAGTAATTAPTSTRRDSVVNYEIDKVIRHIRQGVGTIKRLSVAVVVNNRREVAADGKVTYKPLSKEQLATITDLTREAMGYNKDRGDTLNVVNSPFNLPETPPAADVPFWKAPETLTLLQQSGKFLLMGAALAFFLLGVLRPMLQRLSEQRAQLPPPAPAQETLQPITLPPQVSNYDRNIESARQLALSEPKLVANVVKEWVSGDER
jgi:flagellar M-ring protein FliF